MVAEVYRYNIVRRKGTAEKSFSPELIEHLEFATAKEAKDTLMYIANLYTSEIADSCVVDWLSDHAFQVFWTDDMTIDVNTERWTYAIQLNRYLVEL